MKTLILFFILAFPGCGDKEQPGEEPLPEYDPNPIVRPVTAGINETSGIADSKSWPGHLWLLEDSGHPPRLMLLSHGGALVRTVHLEGARNRDWEELASLNGELFIGDIGDNGKKQSEYTIYTLNEEAASGDTARNVRAIRFRYPDGAHDAEAFLADPATRDIYIITKGDNPSGIFRLKFPYDYTAVTTLEDAGSLAYSGAVGAAISPDGKEIIVKTYLALYSYARRQGESVADALKRNPASLPYKLEPQGEAVTFSRDGSGYFTLSEKAFAASVNLYFYKKK